MNRRTVLGFVLCWTHLVAGRSVVAAEPSSPDAAAFVPLLSEEAARAALPPRQRDRGQKLPAWARALAGPLPRTTAAMLELDLLHRARTPLDPRLAGKLRYATARANRCEYAQAYALADLAREGVDPMAIAKLQTGDWREDEHEAEMKFATRIALNANRATDAEVADLIARRGEAETTGIVLLLAYANFHQRLVQTLGIAVEEEGPLPPVDVRFEDLSAPGGITAPPRTLPDPAPTDVPDELPDDDAWKALSFEQLQANKGSQQERSSRIRIPKWDDVRGFLDPGRSAGPPLRVTWSLVCVGYQPAMARAWGACTRAFARDAAQDRAFEETLFWVHTRALECFY